MNLRYKVKIINLKIQNYEEKVINVRLSQNYDV